MVFDRSSENKKSLSPDASLISNVSDGVQVQNIPVLEKLASSGIFRVNVNRARLLSEEKLESLRQQLDEFFDFHLDQMGHLVDGSTYDLTLRIKAPVNGNKDEKFI